MSRCTILSFIAVIACTALVLSGCGGGGGSDSGTNLPAPAVDASSGVSAPLPTALGQASQENIDQLVGWETLAQENGVLTAALLATQMGTFAQACNESPNDPAAQAGLALALLATAGLNSVAYIGYNPVEEADTRSIGELAVDDKTGPAAVATQAWKLSHGWGVPDLPTGTNKSMQTRALPSSVNMARYRIALRSIILPVVQSSIDRFAAMGNTLPATGVLLTFPTSDGTLVLYPSDFKALAGGLKCFKAALQLFAAPALTYGTYDWNKPTWNRDANRDGILTVAEYFPAAPFGDLDPTLWTGVGALLRGGALDLKTAFAARQPSEYTLLNRIADGDPTGMQSKFNCAYNIFNDTVNVYVDCYKRDSNWNYVLNKTIVVPMRLRELFETPPANLKALLPKLYLMASYAEYSGPLSYLYRDDQDSDLITGSLRYNDGKAACGVTKTPHNLKSTSTSSVPFSLNFTWNWASYSGTYNGKWCSGTLDSWSLSYGKWLDYVPKWSELPDQTFSGVFPDPAKVSSILSGNYAGTRFRYGAFTLDNREMYW